MPYTAAPRKYAEATKICFMENGRKNQASVGPSCDAILGSARISPMITTPASNTTSTKPITTQYIRCESNPALRGYRACQERLSGHSFARARDKGLPYRAVSFACRPQAVG